MKILFITDNFPPEVNAPATRTFEHCVEWVKQGAEVTVLTCFPNYPQGKVYDGYKNKLYQIESIEGIRVIRLWSYIAKNEGFIKRIIDFISFAFMAFWAGLFKKTDIIIATSPQFFTTISASFLAFFKRKPWVFELRDLWPESIVSVGALRNKKIINFLEWVELKLYNSADLIVPVTDAFKSNLISRSINENKIKVITNGTNLDLYKPIPKDLKLIKELGLDDKIIISYIGTHGLAHGLSFILKSIQNINNIQFHFLFIGDGSEKSNLVEEATKLKLENVTFLNPIKKLDIPKYLSISDISLVPLLKRDTFKTVIPSKIFESAGMLKPILLGVEGQAKEIIEKYKAGICFEPENENDFIEKLSKLVNDELLFKELMDGCKNLSNNFDRKLLANEMFHELLLKTSK